MIPASRPSGCAFSASFGGMLIATSSSFATRSAPEVVAYGFVTYSSILVHFVIGLHVNRCLSRGISILRCTPMWGMVTFCAHSTRPLRIPLMQQTLVSLGAGLSAIPVYIIFAISCVPASISASVSTTISASVSTSISASVPASVPTSISASVPASVSTSISASVSASVSTSISASVSISISAPVYAITIVSIYVSFLIFPLVSLCIAVLIISSRSSIVFKISISADVLINVFVK